MAFPSVIVECAFNNIQGEDQSAQTGWTEITKYVDSISGTLRGRSYELDTFETGSVTLVLDNADDRFTPGSAQSPYYPYVKANRRLRIRGKNMQQPNIARSGGQDLDTNGFLIPDTYIWDAVDGTTVRVVAPSLAKHSPTVLGFTGDLGDETYHIESTLKSGAAAGRYRVLAWWAPVEQGVRLTHSAYVWRVSGTEPTGTVVSVAATYYDEDGIEIVPADPNDGRSSWTVPSPTSPTRRVVTDLPPVGARYLVHYLDVTTVAATTTDLTYAVAGVQTEMPSNLAPSISGWTDSYAWEMAGSGTVGQGGTGASDAYVAVTWAADATEVGMTVPRLVPGDDYTVALQAKKTGAGPDVLLTGDDGLTGATLSAENVWTTLTTTFTARRSEQPVKFIPQGTVSGSHTLQIRLVRVAPADPTLQPAVTATDADETEWARPLAIFEGWVERWPMTVTAQSSTVSVTVNDRLKKLGEIILPSTLRAQLASDKADLILPLNDNPKDSQGAVSTFGTWAEQEASPWVKPSTAKTGPGTSVFGLGGLTGPTDEDALKLTAAGTSQGYALALQWSTGTVRPRGTTYHKRFFATWSQTYKGTNATRSDDGGLMYQGGLSGDPNGNQRSLLGFNWGIISHELAGASVLGISVTLYAQYWGHISGGTAYIGTHTLTAKPTTFNPASVKERLWTSVKWPRTTWRTVQLGTTAAVAFKKGTAKGIVIGWGDGTDSLTYGYFAGATSKQFRPYVTIKYKK